MKQLLLITAIIFSLTIHAQKKDTTAKKDTVPQLFDTTRFLSVADVQRVFNAAKPQINGVEYEAFLKVWNYIQATLVREWEDKNKKKP